MSRLRVFLLVGSAALAGCTEIPVRTDQDNQLLATVHCQTYGWAGGFKGTSPLRNSIANPLNESRLRDAIAADLQTAGKVMEGAATTPAVGPAPGAQCLIGYGIGIERQVDAVYPEGWGYGREFWGPRWGGPGWGWGEPYVYHQSFITLDVYEAASHKPLWHASAETSLTGLSGDAATHRIRAAVDAIFLKFPQ